MPSGPSAAPSEVAPAAPDGILAIDKPAGWTSHDVVAVVRRVAGAGRVGHGGTLDPLATGLLPVLVGGATRFSDRLHEAPKAYAALVRFGSETATDDGEGAVRREAALPQAGAAELDAALHVFRGRIAQEPPAYSALKVSGRRAYALARAGRPVALATRDVTVHRLDVASWEPPDLRLLVVCGSGTYVRALARDIGRALGSAAYLAALRRLAVGALSVDQATSPEALRGGGGEALRALLRPADESLLALGQRYLEESAAGLLRGWP